MEIVPLRFRLLLIRRNRPLPPLSGCPGSPIRCVRPIPGLEQQLSFVSGLAEMEGHSKLDLVAAAAILIMFLGAYTLTFSRLGLVLIIGGAIVLLLILTIYRQRT